ncbi:MAG: hypothetical protein JKY15_03820 [Deltaproteobacteria bacterium]|nr:hypothetical protein [Deltaproteobacteria bacterium]
MKPKKTRDFETVVSGARIGGFSGMLEFYIAVLAGLIEITSNIKIAILFFSAAAVVALLGAAIGLIIELSKKELN